MSALEATAFSPGSRRAASRCASPEECVGQTSTADSHKSGLSQFSSKVWDAGAAQDVLKTKLCTTQVGGGLFLGCFESA